MDRIDTHCHIVPPGWRKWSEQLGHGNPDGMPAIPPWTPESHMELMDQLGISKSILSITSPGTYLKPGDDLLARRITRETNGEMADICAQHPTRFGWFASLPLPDVEGSLAEIDHVYDTLGASGVALMTNGHGVYLGDASLDPVFAKLNDRRAVVFMHPTTCHAHTNPTAAKPLDQYPGPMIEFFFDTTRAVANLILSGTIDRYPNVTFLVSHCGAALPPLVERFSQFATAILGREGMSSDHVKHLFRTRFYFDLAGFPFPDLIHGFLKVSDASRLLYGSDFPYTPGPAVVRLTQVMDHTLDAMFGQEKRRDIYSGHARRLLKL